MPNLKQGEESSSSLVVLKFTRSLDNSSASWDDVAHLDEDMAAEAAGRIWGMSLAVHRRGNGHSGNNNVVRSDDDNVSVISIHSSDEEDRKQSSPAAKPRLQIRNQNEPSVFIESIEANSVARDAGAKEGDEIMQLFGAPFSSCMQLFRSLQYAQYIEVTVKRLESAFEKNQRLRLDALLAAQNQTPQGGRRGFTQHQSPMDDEEPKDNARKKKKRMKVSAVGGDPSSDSKQKSKKRRSRENSVSSTTSVRVGSHNESSSSSHESKSSRKFDPNKIILPSGWRKEVHDNGAINFLHVSSGFRVKHSQNYIMPELLEMLSKPFCMLTPKTAFKKLMKKHRNPGRASSTVVEGKAQEMTPAPKDKIPHQASRVVAGSNTAVCSEKKTAQMKAKSKVPTKTIGSGRSNQITLVSSRKLPNFKRPSLEPLTGNELPVSWLPRTESKCYYTHEPTGKKVYSTYVMRIIIRLMLEIPGIDVEDALKIARKEDEEAKEKFLKQKRADRGIVTKPQITSSGKRKQVPYNPDDLPKGWKRELGASGKNYYYEHIQSGIKEYSFRIVLKVPKILKRKGPKLSLMEAIKVAKEEDAKEREALIVSHDNGKSRKRAASTTAQAKSTERVESTVQPRGGHTVSQSAKDNQAEEVRRKDERSIQNVTTDPSRLRVKSEADRSATLSAARTGNGSAIQQTTERRVDAYLVGDRDDLSLSNWV